MSKVKITTIIEDSEGHELLNLSAHTDHEEVGPVAEGAAETLNTLVNEVDDPEAEDWVFGGAENRERIRALKE